MGKRISRGLFRSSIMKLINADAKSVKAVQGGYNIIKKAIPKAFMNLVVITKSSSRDRQHASDGIEGEGLARLASSPTSPVGLHPIRINPLTC